MVRLVKAICSSWAALSLNDLKTQLLKNWSFNDLCSFVFLIDSSQIRFNINRSLQLAHFWGRGGYTGLLHEQTRLQSGLTFEKRTFHDFATKAPKIGKYR